MCAEGNKGRISWSSIYGLAPVVHVAEYSNLEKKMNGLLSIERSPATFGQHTT
jgi:hypothetical protein